MLYRWLLGALAGFILISLILAPAAPAMPSESDEFTAAIELLKSRSFKTKGEAIERVERSGDERAVRVLEALLKGELYYQKKEKRVVYARQQDGKYQLSEVIYGAELGSVPKRTLKKISINNKLRKALRFAIARLNLSAHDPKVRLAAVDQILENLTTDAAALLEQARARENDEDVLQALRLGLALHHLKSDDRKIRLEAIAVLDGNPANPVRGALQALAAQDPDPEVRDAAVRALAKIDAKLKAFAVIETVFFGISLGSVLLLAAIGLAITFGVMGVINMAHGELIMLGAYTTYVVQLVMPNHIDLSLFVALPAAFLVSGMFGIAIERGVIRFLYGRPLETLLATFGISLVLQQLVRTVFSPLNRSVSTPSWMSGSLEINSALSLTYNRLYIVVFSLLVFAALVMVLKKTPLGLQIRAVTQNRGMAKAMGIRTQWVDALTFGLGSGIAGLAGVALSQLTNVGPNLGQSYIIDSFMVVVFGGVGNLWGTLVGSLSLGMVNKFLEPYSGAVLAKISILVFIIVFIQKRPRGLFPQKGRAAES